MINLFGGSGFVGTSKKLWAHVRTILPNILVPVPENLMFFNLDGGYDTAKEGFLSGFRKMYRPYIRKARLYTTSKYSSFSDKTSVFLRRWGFW